MLKVLLLVVFTTLLSANDIIKLGNPMPSWIDDPSTTKLKNNTYSNKTHFVQGDKNNKIIWYKRYIEITGGSFGVYKDWPNEDEKTTSKYSHATIIYEEDGAISNKKSHNYVTVDCNDESMLCDKFERIESWLVSLKAGPHRPVKVEVYYKDGDVTKMTYEYKNKNTNIVNFSIERGHRI